MRLRYEASSRALALHDYIETFWKFAGACSFRKAGKEIEQQYCVMQLSKNPQLTTFFVRNFNLDPSNWSLADNSIDAVTCCVRYSAERSNEDTIAPAAAPFALPMHLVMIPDGWHMFMFQLACVEAVGRQLRCIAVSGCLHATCMHWLARLLFTMHGPRLALSWTILTAACSTCNSQRRCLQRFTGC